MKEALKDFADHRKASRNAVKEREKEKVRLGSDRLLYIDGMALQHSQARSNHIYVKSTASAVRYLTCWVYGSTQHDRVRRIGIRTPNVAGLFWELTVLT